jgi:putative photosynthetic complex assembly protein 2
MNALMPVSVIGSLILCAWLMTQADRAAEGSAMATGFVLLFTLAALALLEHFFMVLPVQDAALWRWASPHKGVQKSEPNSTTDKEISPTAWESTK